MTKKERRKAQLERHYSALVRLAEACGVKKADGKKLSVALLKIERVAHEAAEDYCNGKDRTGFNYGSDEWDEDVKQATDRVKALFDGVLPQGFFINGDPRGCALKLDSDKARELIEKTGLERDWGGYGLLAPEITGA